MTLSLRTVGDLLAVVFWTVCTAVAVLVVGIESSALRTLLVLPLVVFFPGYALLNVLFPERPGRTTRTSHRPSSDRTERRPQDELSQAPSADSVALGRLERVVLALVISLGLVPLVAFVVNYTPYGFSLRPIMVAVVGVTLVLTTMAVIRRGQLPSSSRRSTSVLSVLSGTVRRYIGDSGYASSDSPDTPHPFAPRTGTHRAFNVLLVIGLLTLVASVGYTAFTPPGDDTGFTEAYLVTETQSGEYTAENLSTNLTSGERTELVLALGNHEHDSVTYTVVTTLDGEEIDRTEVAVDADETRYTEQVFTPRQRGGGEPVPLEFFVYNGDAPDTPSSETADVTVDLWVTIQ